MAYMSQERKKIIASALKEALKGTGLKYSLSVIHHSTIKMTIRSGEINFLADFIGKNKPFNPDHIGINHYYYKEDYQGRSLEILKLIYAILNEGNHDRSDSQSDYFDVGWYCDIYLGEHCKPYIYTGGENNAKE